jgi:hypothetical protein
MNKAMGDLDLSLETADRVIGRAVEGVVLFRAMNATEEDHVLRALIYYRDIALKSVDIAAENIRLHQELQGYRQRAADNLTI